MCQQHGSDDHTGPGCLSTSTQRHDDTDSEAFPWDLGVFDAHCHPTDTMSTVSSISNMKARALTVMSTRSQDQELVHNVAMEQGVQGEDMMLSEKRSAQRIVPAFGWHPWFSYQIWDDRVSGSKYDGTEEGKIAHYDKILSPAPSSKDVSFSTRLPDPRPLSDFINETRSRLEKHPHALVGEIGLDKAFRIPESWSSPDDITRDEHLTPGGREGRRLSPHRVSIEHQTAILKAQLRLAGELNRAVSVHGVQVHGGVYTAISDCWKGHEKEVLSRREQRKVASNAEDFSEDEDGTTSKRSKSAPATKTGTPFPPRICLHSYSGPVNIMNQYLHKSVPAKVFFSFSEAVNFVPDVRDGDKNQKTEDAIRTCPDDRILVESDLHIAGDRMDEALEAVCRKVCELKGWQLRRGVEQLAQNYKEFVFGE